MFATLYKNGKTVTVPAGAVRKYISAGWQPVNEVSRPVEKKITSQPKEEKNEELERLINDDEEYEEYEEVEVDPEELAQKPLNELDRDELRILAEYKGIDTDGMTSSKQLRAAIKSLE